MFIGNEYVDLSFINLTSLFWQNTRRQLPKMFFFHINWRKIEKWGLYRLTDISSNFCVHCFYEAVDTMPSPEFSDWEENVRVNFSDAIGSTESKYYPITTRLRKLLTLPPPFMRTVALDGVRNSRLSTFNQKAATKRWRLTICTNVRHLCKLLANCEFALHGVRNSKCFSLNVALSTKHTKAAAPNFFFHINWRKIEKWGLHWLTDISSNFFITFRLQKYGG